MWKLLNKCYNAGILMVIRVISDKLIIMIYLHKTSYSLFAQNCKSL